MTNLTQIADSGDTLATLKALRHKLAETIDRSSSGRDIAALARQLQIVTGQISDLEAQQAEDPVGEIIRNRKAMPVRDVHGKVIYQNNEIE